MMRAEAHGSVDRLDIADSFIERIDRLVDHREQNAIDDKGGKIFGDRDRFAELGHELFGGLESRIAGGNAADQLDQFHQRYRIHEMNTDETLRSVDDASRVIEIEDVLVPMIASGFSVGQRLEKIARLTSSFSVAASITRSQ